MKSSLKCPACGKELKTEYMWEKTSIGHEYNLESGDVEYDAISGDSSDLEAWSCGGCGADLPPETVGKIEELVL